MKNYIIFLLFATSFLVYSCQKVDPVVDPIVDPVVETTLDGVYVDPAFLFKTTLDVQAIITAKDNQNLPLAGVRFNIYNGAPSKNGQLVSSGVTDAAGIYATTLSSATTADSLVVTTSYIGLLNQAIVPIKNNKLEITFGGTSTKKSKFVAISPITYRANIIPMGTYNSQGVPSYLEPQNAVLDATFLKDVNATLPENYPVPTNNPQYLATSNETDVLINQKADIWVTFVHEGAGWMNVLGYYTYNIANPPTAAAQITDIHIIFPNFSLTGSGGGLNLGNRVKLGTFEAGTGIGWVLIANGWSNGRVTAGSHMVYSNPDFNPETDPKNRQHNVVLHDMARKLILIGFEDMKRNPSDGSDNDFNDALFYVKANPVEAIETSNLPPTKTVDLDTDKDGIPDVSDDYPNDITKAFNNYYPSKTAFSTLAYEDIWPSKGDYDFNDVVLDYQVNPIANANNDIVEINAKIYPKATGAGYLNGFGIQLPILANSVKSVTGTKLSEGFINVLANGVEANQTNAVVIVFDNAQGQFKNVTGTNPSGLAGINTSNGGRIGTADTIKLKITFNSPVKLSALGQPPYNPFIIANKKRGYEIHLPDNKPTDLMDKTLFGKADDKSSVAQNKYFKTVNNLPWAINIVYPFAFPTERKTISSTYLHFIDWAKSGGTSYKDWYLNTAGYRNSANVFIR